MYNRLFLTLSALVDINIYITSKINVLNFTTPMLTQTIYTNSHLIFIKYLRFKLLVDIFICSTETSTKDEIKTGKLTT